MERPEFLETGGISMSGLQADGILRAVEYQLVKAERGEVPAEYSVKNFSQRVFMFIESTAPRVADWQGLRKS
jgi:UDP-N-acetylglucosamine 2-epimerase (non-hydrolysing)